MRAGKNGIAKDAQTGCKRASNALRKMPERIAKGHRLQGIVHQSVTLSELFRAILSHLIVRNSMPTACSAHRFRTPGYCLPTLYQSAKLINKHPTDKYISDKTHFIRLSLTLFVFVGLTPIITISQRLLYYFFDIILYILKYFTYLCG